MNSETCNTPLRVRAHSYKFTLKRIKAEALKTLRCQGNLGPQRVLHLLKETIAKHNTVRQATEEQTAADPEQNK